MAKNNQKKEKAARNKENANKYKKRSNKFGKRSFSNQLTYKYALNYIKPNFINNDFGLAFVLIM